MVDGVRGIQNCALKIKPDKFSVKFSAPFALVFRIGERMIGFAYASAKIVSIPSLAQAVIAALH
jgi:hypothetical protein